MVMFRRRSSDWGKIAIFDQYVALASITAGPSRVVNISTVEYIHLCVVRLQRSTNAAAPRISKSCLRQQEAMTTPNRTKQNLIVRIGKSEAEVTNNKVLHLRYCTVEANYR